MSETFVIEAENLSKVYRIGDIEVRALDGVSLCVKRGELISIMGPSGSGKSTMMNILGCLSIPSSGEYRLDGERVSELSEDQLADIRNRKVGFVFQKFMLLPRQTALANVELPMLYAGVPDAERRERAVESLRLVGLGDRMEHKPVELSGGQQQRVAVARALVMKPAILMADEPTGNLDTRSTREIMDLILDLNRNRGATVIIITHNPEIGGETDRIVRIRDGKVEAN